MSNKFKVINFAITISRTEMLCRRFKQTVFNKSTLNNKTYNVLFSRLTRRCLLYDSFLTIYKGESSMSTFRFTLKDLRFTRLWSVWRRNFSISEVVKRCRKDVRVKELREVIQVFKHALLRPRRTILFATAAFNSRTQSDDTEPPPSCEKDITDEELEALLTELDGVEELSKTTLFCTSCGKRLVVEKKLPGIRYCACNHVSHCEASDGWEPYMEAEDVMIWRKEYKPGQGLYAYKVYGRYKDVAARDFAAVQVDSAYRRAWDSAVASLSVVEHRGDQAVLHWEVLWPRLFANRDYVYIRRHKVFDVTSSRRNIHTENIFEAPSLCTKTTQVDTQRPSVHSRAKRIAMESYEREQESNSDNKVYVIVSRSCEHADVPETKHAIRVSEYWSHMVVRTLNGADKPGMEFVLTYYDEPAVGGLPAGVAAWATGRAAPAYLRGMRAAAARYACWTAQELPDCSMSRNKKTCHERDIKEDDMESTHQGPDLDNGDSPTRDQATQTDIPEHCPTLRRNVVKDQRTPYKARSAGNKIEQSTQEGDADKPEEEKSSGGWWRYLYPFYYFV